jgi:2-iminobutanoate/2-iminopropanoate deaminase
MTKNIVRTEDAPAPFEGAPYNQAVIANGFVFTAGQVGIDAATGEVVSGGVKAETEQTFANIEAVLRAAGSSMANIVKTSVFLLDMADFAVMNSVYAQRVPAPHPARSTVQVARLPGTARVEIEVVALA